MALVKIDQKEYDRLQRKAAELDDYYQAAREIRSMAVPLAIKAGEGSQFAEGWLACLKDQAAVLLRVMANRS